MTRNLLVYLALSLATLTLIACDKGGDSSGEKKKESSGQEAAEDDADPCALLAACAEAWPDAKPMHEAATSVPESAAEMCTQTMNGLYYNPDAPDACKTLPKAR